MRLLLLAILNKTSSGNIFGGAEKSIINLANWLAQNTEHEVYLSSVEGKEKPYYIDDKVKYNGMEVNEKSKIAKHNRIRLNTVNEIRRVNPDIVISFWVQPLFYMVLSGIRLPFIYSERNDPSLEYGFIAQKMRDIVLKHAKGVVFQTKDAQHFFKKQIQDKSIIIHNPVYIPYDAYELTTTPDNRIVSVGRLNTQKNYSLLIRAFGIVSKDYPELQLIIYGEGPLRQQLQSEIESLCLEDRIELPGSFPDVIDRIYGAKAFVMPSLYEGMPNALMEAMALGIPVISSDCPCGGPRELIEHGINGFLFDCNSEDSLLCTLKNLLNKPYDIEMCIREKNICNTHNKDTIFKRWLDYIEQSVYNAH